MFAGCFGLIFNDFLIEVDMNSTSVTLLMGVSCMSVAVSGYFTSNLCKIMSMRKCALLSAVILNIGSLGTVFANTKILFFIFQGVFLGAGFGVLYTITCTLLNDYFIKRRLLFISIAQTVTGISALLAPQLVKLTLEEYGYRGTLIIICCFMLQTFVAVSLMQPVVWHMKKVEVADENTDEIKLLLVDKNANETVLSTPLITMTDPELATKTKEEIHHDIKHDIEYSDEKPTGGIKQKINEMLDIKLLKKFCLSNASMGPTFCMFAEMNFTLMLPQALYEMKWDQYSVAKAIMLNCFGDLVTRTMFIFISKWVTKLGNQEVYLIGLVVAFVSRLCMLWTEKPTVVLLFITLIGVARSSILVLPPVILAEVFTPEEFTKAMGIFMMLFGVMNLVLGPAIGAVRDMTKSYPTAFYIITTSFAVVILLWTLELVYKKNKNRRKLQLLAAEELKRKRNKNRGNQ
ncbi:monocarboxylate transporter 14-like [Hyposmocoma kahamanoa]|uniref:monocarboxylate transporter 14-like n=1 Tax=Hyposmocoma kahamanoa TaxID=1477025 RepID=UPI000E6DA213|nr:monocarboxylate transporter 14-like [Hyposmocoma kahamanoa]